MVSRLRCGGPKSGQAPWVNLDGLPLSPLAANIYLNEVDWAFDAIRRKTAEGSYEAVNYHRFADDVRRR